MSTLRNFISAVKGGIARSNAFAVQVNLPAAMAIENLFKSKLQKIMLLCDQSALPGVSIGTNQVRDFGEFKEVPYEKLYEPISLNFIVDNNMLVKFMFDRWLSIIQDTQTRIHAWPAKYKSTVDIFTYDKQNNQKYRIRLHEAFPKAISPIALDYAARDVMKLNVQFSYKYLTTTLLDLSIHIGEIPQSYLNDFEIFNVQLNL